MNILIIKLGALGDVLRTTPLLTELKRQYPSSTISWLVDPSCLSVLEGNTLIDQLLSYSEENLSRLKKERFDLSVNLDKEPEALDAIMSIPSHKRMGFGRSKTGALCALDPLSDYAYRLGVDDELKFRQNKKTYQEICFEQLGLRFNGQEYIFSLKHDSVKRAKECLGKIGANPSKIKRPVIGLNTGSGNRFAGKRLPVTTFLELIEKFSVEMNASIFILGGKDEVERNKEIARLSKQPVVNTGSHPIHDFAAIVRECDLIVSGDTTAMHIAIAVKVPVVAYFASTCSAEIELYGRGKKVVSNISCSPCYKKICPIDEQCMKDVKAADLFKASQDLLMKTVKR